MKTKKKSKWRHLRQLILKLLLFGLVTYGVFTFVLGGIRISGNNMFPMLKDGDFCLYYRTRDVYLEDMVIYEDSTGNLRAGRIKAVGGQTVDFLKDGGLLVDGSIPSEYLPYDTLKAENSEVKYPIQLGSDEYFILNDYRSDTTDSRQYGAVSVSSIKGKGIFILRRRSI